MSADPALAMLVPSPHGRHDAHAPRSRRTSQSGRGPLPEIHSQPSHGHRPEAHPSGRPRLPYEAIERAQQEIKLTDRLDSAAAQSRPVIAKGAVAGPNPSVAVTGFVSTVPAASSAAPTDGRPAATEALSRSAPATVNPDAAPSTRLPESAGAPIEQQTDEAPVTPHPEGAALAAELHAGGASIGERNVGCWSGSLPVLFAGELVELDLYARHQDPGAARDGMRQLTLSLLAANGDRLEASASLKSNRLRVQLAGPAAGTYGTMRIQARAVGELAARLGWTFDAVDHADARPDEDALNQLF